MVEIIDMPPVPVRPIPTAYGQVPPIKTGYLDDSAETDAQGN